LIEDRTVWHPAFSEALRAVYRKFQGLLEFDVEHQLTAEPLRIDLVVVKKLGDMTVDMPTGRIFKGHNLFEYKSPTDYLSEWDFQKTLGYTHLYSSQKKIHMSDITLSLVTSHHPRGVFKYLKTLSRKIVEKYPGVYYVGGDIVPIQVILNNRLVDAEKIWLGSLRDDLTAVEMTELVRISYEQDLFNDCKAFFDVVLKENAAIFKEVMKMGDKEFYDVIEESGLGEKWRLEGMEKGIEKGMEKGKIQVAIKMIQDGFSLNDVSKYSDIPVEKLKGLS
jgi:hypothetical protein